jgi:hypothetical protein
MQNLFKIIGTLLLLAICLPTHGADELVEGVQNEHTLMLFLGVGVLLLFSCVMALIFMLYQTLPTLLKEKFEKEKAQGKISQAQETV